MSIPWINKIELFDLLRIHSSTLKNKMKEINESMKRNRGVDKNKINRIIVSNNIPNVIKKQISEKMGQIVSDHDVRNIIKMFGMYPDDYSKEEVSLAVGNILSFTIKQFKEMDQKGIEIIDRIYLGSYEAAKDLDFIKNNKITVIVNCTKDLQNKYSPDFILNNSVKNATPEVQKWILDNMYYIDYYRIPVDDNDTQEENETFYLHTKEILSKISELYNDGHTILIHCFAGVQRSASFTSVLLSKLLDCSLDDAISIVQIKKPNTFFFGSRFHFLPAMQLLEKE